MHTLTGSVAVLLFSLPATEEARRKPLADSKPRSERAWQALEQLALGKIQAAGLPSFLAHELPTRPSGTFGEQLWQAAQAVLDLGYESVICVGNDCPSIRSSDLVEAARIIQSGAIPVGTDKRGGVYLTGFNRALLANDRALTSLPWQTTNLAAALLNFLHQHGQHPVSLSTCRPDWNARCDVRLGEAVGLKKWLHTLNEAFILLNADRPPVQFSFFTSCRPASVGLRGPPTSLRLHLTPNPSPLERGAALQ